MSSDRTIEHEIVVPGTPEQVWNAIATGHGITAWFVPTKVEEHVGGAVELDFGPGAVRCADRTIPVGRERTAYVLRALGGPRCRCRGERHQAALVAREREVIRVEAEVRAERSWFASVTTSRPRIAERQAAIGGVLCGRCSESVGARLPVRSAGHHPQAVLIAERRVGAPLSVLVLPGHVLAPH
jgi:hypothetical protein